MFQGDFAFANQTTKKMCDLNMKTGTRHLMQRFALTMHVHAYKLTLT